MLVCHCVGAVLVCWCVGAFVCEAVCASVLICLRVFCLLDCCSVGSFADACKFGCSCCCLLAFLFVSVSARTTLHRTYICLCSFVHSCALVGFACAFLCVTFAMD